MSIFSEKDGRANKKQWGHYMEEKERVQICLLFKINTIFRRRITITYYSDIVENVRLCKIVVGIYDQNKLFNKPYLSYRNIFISFVMA